MKVIELIDCNFNDKHRLPPMILNTDSSVVISGRPVFLPEISERWECRIGLAVRISRLGKSISRRFAHRYYDAMTLAARIVPCDLDEELASRGERFSPWATAFDGSLAMGSWIEGVADSVEISVDSPVEIHTDINHPAAAIDSAIELLSRTMMLKTGDIIIPGIATLTFPITPDLRAEASLNGNKILKFNIK